MARRDSKVERCGDLGKVEISGRGVGVLEIYSGWGRGI